MFGRLGARGGTQKVVGGAKSHTHTQSLSGRRAQVNPAEAVSGDRRVAEKLFREPRL